MHAALYGPVPAPDDDACDVRAGLERLVHAPPATATYVTEPVTLTVPGYYTYRECDRRERARARRSQTRVRRGRRDDGRAGHAAGRDADQRAGGRGRAPRSPTACVVTGLGALDRDRAGRAVGPVRRRARRSRCTGTPLDAARFTANGDGTYTTAPSTLDARRLLHLPRVDRRDGRPTPAVDDGVRRGRRDDARLGAAAAVTTVVSDEVVRPGSRISDEIRVRGPRPDARPASRSSCSARSRPRARCAATATPFWRGQVTAQGDGTVRSPAVRVRTAGFYTYRERLARRAERRGHHDGVRRSRPRRRWRRPPITTGRGDVARDGARRADVGGADADARAPALGHRRAGLARRHRPAPRRARRPGRHPPRAAGGATARRPAAARARSCRRPRRQRAARASAPSSGCRAPDRGDRVSVTTRDGRTRSYRVTSVRACRKAALPASVYSRSGARAGSCS